MIGQIPGTGHFRNVKRHAVVTDPAILSLRVAESLYFPNARFIEDQINGEVAANCLNRIDIYKLNNGLGNKLHIVQNLL